MAVSTDYFNTPKVLDGGMGQDLFARGVQPVGTLWSASALIDPQYHGIVRDAHLDFIDAGADVIVTNTFTTRRTRLVENNIGDQFESLNQLAGQLAQDAKAQRPHVVVAGGLPPQQFTYEPDTRNNDAIMRDFLDQAVLLDPFVDFFYLDVLSSIREMTAAIAAIEPFNKPFLIGAHVSQGRCLPSGESVSQLKALADYTQLMGVILACVSPETALENVSELQGLGVPFGVKVNAFKTTSPVGGYTQQFQDCCSGNPNEFLGTRTDLCPATMARMIQPLKDAGATILGGCCETTPAHIRAIAGLNH